MGVFLGESESGEVKREKEGEEQVVHYFFDGWRINCLCGMLSYEEIIYACYR